MNGTALADRIKREREYLDKIAPPASDPVWGGQLRAEGGIGSRDKIEMAFDRLFGLTGDDLTKLGEMTDLYGRPLFEGLRTAEDFKTAPRPRGIQELYVLVSGDGEVSGRFDRSRLPQDLRAAQDITSGTFSYALGNTMYRRLVKDYRALKLPGKPPDFHQQACQGFPAAGSGSDRRIRQPQFR